MRVVAQFCRRFVSMPVVEMRSGKPIARFSKLQFMAYPELCRKQFHEALSHCDERSRQSQLAVAQAYFGRSIAYV